MRVNGGRRIIYYRGEDVVTRVRELTGGRGVDLVLDHVCGPDFFTYLRALDKWGTVVSYNAFDGLPTQNMMGRCASILTCVPPSAVFHFISTTMTGKAVARSCGR